MNPEVPSPDIPETLDALRVPVESLNPYSDNPRRGDLERIVESLELGLQGIDALDGLAQFLKLALVGRPEQPAGNGAKHL